MFHSKFSFFGAGTGQVEKDSPGTFLKNPISSVICHANDLLNLRSKKSTWLFKQAATLEIVDLSDFCAKLFVLSAIFQVLSRYAILVPSY